MQPPKALFVLAVVNGIVAFTMVFEAPRALPDLGIIRREHSAFAAGGHDFVLAEREGRNMSQRAHGAALVRRPLSLRAIFDDSQIVLRRQLHDLIHIAGPSREVDRDDRARSRSNRAPYGFHSDVLTVGVHIDANRTSPPHHNATRGCNERARSRNHFIAATNAKG